jgi:hypothetical protein
MVRLTREQILAAPLEPKRVKITIKAWGGTFYVREWTAAELDEWEAAIVANDKQNVRAITCVRSLVDESGSPVFDDADAEALGAKRGIGGILDRIAKVARSLNNLDAEDFEVEKGNS